MKTLARALALLAIGGGVGAASVVGCGASGAASTLGGSVCEPGSTETCSCTVVSGATQVCNADGRGWGPCMCGGVDAGTDAGPDGSVCGDQVCGGSENCVTCPADCGDCPACSLAPSCTGASSVPGSPTALPAFNNAGMSMYTSGVGFGDPNADMICSYPLLKMRVSQVVVHKNGAPGSLELFCTVQADDGQSSQLIITPDYKNLSDNNPALILAPAAGTFWGEAVNGVKLSQFNVTVTYQCWMVQQPDALQNALMAVAGFAGAASAIPGNPYGWAFGAAGAAAAAAAAAAAIGNGATPLLNVQQTIDSSALLKLTNGYTWTIEQTGSTKADGDCNVFSSCDWDWELDVEAWGCAAPKGDTPQ